MGNDLPGSQWQAVTLDITDTEYELLKRCCREYDEIGNFEGLEGLYERIVAAARDESEFCEPDDCLSQEPLELPLQCNFKTCVIFRYAFPGQKSPYLHQKHGWRYGGNPYEMSDVFPPILL